MLSIKGSGKIDFFSLLFWQNSETRSPKFQEYVIKHYLTNNDLSSLIVLITFINLMD